MVIIHIHIDYFCDVVVTPVVTPATTIVVVSSIVCISVAEGSVAVTLVVITLDIGLYEAFNNLMQ